MKYLRLLLPSLFLLSASASGQGTFQFLKTVNSLVPDGNPTGLASTINVSGLYGPMTNINVFLTVSGGYNGDLYACLTGPNGGFAVLLNRSGMTALNGFGYGDAGFNITLTDLAVTDVHSYGGNGGGQLPGTWQPDGRAINPQFAFDTVGRTAMLNSFDNLDPNGTWTLFVADMAGGYQSTLTSWGMQVNVVPEPSPVALTVLGLGTLAVLRRRFRC
jgi:subtilisin-like proprotein convertase family protein